MDSTDLYPLTCALYLEENICGADSRRKKEAGLYKISSLTDNTSHKKNDGTYVKECELIESRLGEKIAIDKYLCSFHWYKYGLSWKPPKTCQHLLHKEESKDFWHRKHKASLRPASWSNYTKIKDTFPGQFLIGGMLCIPHRKNPVEDLEVNIEDLDVNIVDLDVNIVDKDPDFVLPPALTDPSTKEDMDRLLDNSTEDVSPIKFQIQSAVNDMSDASLRYHKRKYKEVKAAFKKRFVAWLHRDKQKSLKALYPPNLTTKIVTNLIG